jgi:hypothetical protein
LADLDASITKAHENGDGHALAAKYLAAAQVYAELKAVDQAAFLTVQAYVWALDAGAEEIVTTARRWLVQHGRER